MTATAPSAPAADTATAPPRAGFLGWYRRYYLLVNLPILLGLTELVVSKLDVANRPPFDRENDLKHAFDRVAAHPVGDRPLLLVMGNSVILGGLEQDVVEAGLGRPDQPVRVYNFGLGGANVEDQFKLVDLLADRGLHPRAVVLGVNLYLVDDRHRDPLRAAYPRTSPYLFFHRARLRRALQRAFKHRHLEWRPYDQARIGQDTAPKTLAAFEPALRAFAKEFRGRTPADIPMIARLGDFRAWLAQRGIKLYVVLLPMNPLATSRLDNYQTLLDGIRAACPGLLDLTADFPKDLFLDEGHVNDIGRTKLTQAVTTWLAAKPEVFAP